jgi:hypothetical protein
MEDVPKGLQTTGRGKQSATPVPMIRGQQSAEGTTELLPPRRGFGLFARQ